MTNIENLRSYTTMPFFEYNGMLITAILYKKGNSDMIHSFDVVTRQYNLSKMNPIERQEVFGLTETDMLKLKIRVQSYIDFKEGRKP